MSLLNRINSGLVFRDQFNTHELDPKWQVSPSDESRYTLTEEPGCLRLRHGDPDLYILMDSPRFDFVFEIDTNYDPLRASDQGGITVYRDHETFIELLEFYDPNTGTTIKYDTIRMIKRADLYEGYGTNDGGRTWELIGTSFMSATKIGMVLHGVLEADSDTLDVKEVRMYRDTSLQIANLVEGMTVRLFDGAGLLLSEQKVGANKDHAKLNLQNTTFPLTGKLELYDATGTFLAETAVFSDLWGGDVFYYGVKLDLEIDSVLVRPDREYQLGYMKNGSIEKKVKLINTHDVTVYNVHASVLAHSDYYGWEWVDIANDVFGQPGTYKDVILVGDIGPGQSVNVWIKIVRQPKQQMASLQDYKFRLLFESG